MSKLEDAREAGFQEHFPRDQAGVSGDGEGIAGSQWSPSGIICRVNPFFIPRAEAEGSEGSTGEMASEGLSDSEMC